MLNKVASMYRNILFRKMNSTQEALRVFKKIKYWVWFMNISFWVAIFLIFYTGYYSNNSTEISYTILFFIFSTLFMALLPLWFIFNEWLNNSYAENKSLLEKLNLHIGDKVDFIDEDGFRKEGKLTRISMTWFEFSCKDFSIHIMDWLLFKEKNYILV